MRATPVMIAGIMLLLLFMVSCTQGQQGDSSSVSAPSTESVSSQPAAQEVRSTSTEEQLLQQYPDDLDGAMTELDELG